VRRKRPSIARQAVHYCAPLQLWVKSGRYWIAYQTAPAPVIVAVYFETANIPARLWARRRSPGAWMPI
jgi:hypothetical protein